jgi:hypothetical protein
VTRGREVYRGERGEPGPAPKQPVIVGWKVDVKNFRAVPFGPDGKPLPELDLYPLSQALSNLLSDMVADMVREELEHLLRQKAIGSL